MKSSRCGWRCIGTLMAALLLFLVGAPAIAAPCTESGSRAPNDIRVPNIVVSRDAPVGTVLGRVTSAQGSYRLECSTRNNVLTTTLGLPLRREIMQVLDMNGRPIPGLGMRLAISSSVIRRSDGACVGDSSVTLNSRHELRCNFYVAVAGVPSGGEMAYAPLTLTFVKTSQELASTELGMQTVLTMRMDNYSPIEFRITGGRVVANPCTFDIPSRVSLGTMSAAAMNSGQAAPPASFQMRVDCTSSAKYKVKFTPSGGSTAVVGRTGVMSNSAAAGTAANNVAVQLQDMAGTPVSLDEDIDLGSQPAVSAANYQARMVSNGAGQVEAGRVAAALEVNFTFY